MKKSKGITINDKSIESYLDDTYISDIEKEAISESRKNIGGSRKPFLRYESKKEPPGQCKIFDQSEINLLYQGKIMQYLKDIDAPKIRYIITVLLTGKAFTYKGIREYLIKNAGMKITTPAINTCVRYLYKSKIGFILNKVKSSPAEYMFDPRVTAMKESVIYDLYLKSGKVKLEAACKLYPFLIDIMKEKGIEIINDQESKPEPKTKTEYYDGTKLDINTKASNTAPSMGIYDVNAVAPEPVIQEQKTPEKKLPKKDEFNLNINVTFRIFFGD